MNRALLVAIETYNAGNVPSLNGCINDITGIEQFLLQAAGFASGDCLVLTNQAATRAAIVQSLTQLVNGLNPGDRLVFHYAGHGAALPNGGATEDAIIPVDFSFPTTNAIFGSEMASILGGIPSGVAFSWIDDCCNSGGQIRSVMRVTRGLPLPTELAKEIAQLGPASAANSMRGIADTLNLVMYAACTANQEANGAQINGVWHGALSYYLTSLLMDPATVGNSATQLIQSANASIAPNFPQQTPELHGNPALFGDPFLPGLGGLPGALNAHFTTAAFVGHEKQIR